MNIEALRAICLELPGVTEDVKWGNDLCFLIAEKMFCVTGLEGGFTVSMKVTDEEFEELTAREGIIPAPYMARYKWIYLQDASAFSQDEWKKYVHQSYELIKSKLPKKILKQYGLID